MDAGNQTLVPCKSSKALNTELSLQAPRFYNFKVLEFLKTMGLLKLDCILQYEINMKLQGWESGSGLWIKVTFV